MGNVIPTNGKTQNTIQIQRVRQKSFNSARTQTHQQASPIYFWRAATAINISNFELLQIVCAAAGCAHEKDFNWKIIIIINYNNKGTGSGRSSRHKYNLLCRVQSESVVDACSLQYKTIYLYNLQLPHACDLDITEFKLAARIVSASNIEVFAYIRWMCAARTHNTSHRYICPWFRYAVVIPVASVVMTLMSVQPINVTRDIFPNRSINVRILGNDYLGFFACNAEHYSIEVLSPIPVTYGAKSTLFSAFFAIVTLLHSLERTMFRYTELSSTKLIRLYHSKIKAIQLS